MHPFFGNPDVTPVHNKVQQEKGLHFLINDEKKSSRGNVVNIESTPKVNNMFLPKLAAFL